MRIKGICGGIQNLLTMLFEVIKLASMQRPAEHGEDEKHEHRRQRNEQVHDVHGGQRARRNELITTTSELVAMPRPAAHGGKYPNTASGTQAAL
jgi:hypothetical protein